VGYTTEFEGSFSITPSLDIITKKFINKFSETRHVSRNIDPKYGVEGEFYIHDDNSGIINSNLEPSTQPGLWCQWIINDYGRLKWDGGEKFYNYTEWLVYLIENFFAPHDYTLGGEVKYQGERSDDIGKIIVYKNIVILGNNDTIIESNDQLAKFLLIKQSDIEIYIPKIKEKIDLSTLL